MKQHATFPLRYQHPLTKDWYLVDIRNISDKNIYQFLKLINPTYPKLNDLLPASTTVLEARHLTKHIQWIERWLAENGIVMDYISEEWDKILLEAGINK